MGILLQEMRKVVAVFFFGYTVLLTWKYAEAKNYTAVRGNVDEY